MKDTESIFHRLYDQYHQDVFQFLIYLVKNRTVAEDLSHEVYVRVLKSYERFQGRSSEKTWLFAIAKNVAIDYFRKNSVRSSRNFDAFDWETEQLVSPTKSPELILELNDDLRQLLTALEKCTGDQKMVVIMRYIQELSIAETAEILNWTEAKVKTTQHRAIKNLREILTQNEKEASHYESRKMGRQQN
ncbi:RNA polymerase sigma-70 factor (ECF subfamily) [Lysinibacillus composti]|uniref:Sigma-70 family RNA polymerase sigma factor n=1 Tax=Lysinibacillus composti TaxID=720633 RepID=A0A3N9UDQ5_9BACI|nr:RNA polymerase sigma factor SigX [Lysinibacillus composti]MBM7610445.1 RNA polymerase sigma-70 factor (ECF subfamily) [Lysinibacillus composti]RQW74371.1 sigma-70 family RNA polymerase sigma factor [Lysinibacillus composti]